MKKQYSNKERKLWKLKRKNVVLGQQRNALVKSSIKDFGAIEGLGYVPFDKQRWSSKELNKLMYLSEQIGKNSAKIQRLRTQIQQEKISKSLEEKTNGDQSCS